MGLAGEEALPCFREGMWQCMHLDGLLSSAKNYTDSSKIRSYNSQRDHICFSILHTGSQRLKLIRKYGSAVSNYLICILN
jgi:hypothetical protein